MASTGTMGIVNPSKLESSQDDVNSLVSVGTPLGVPGRIKKAPVCSDKSLKETAMQPAALSKMCFTFEVPVVPLASEAVPVSSASSTCESSGTLSDVEITALATTTTTGSGEGGEHVTTPPVKLDRGISDRLNAKISLRKTSRQGRSTQRWVTEGDSNEAIRMVTGCVPILRGGKILFVSASRKPEWILPKGGWELDETLEESAIRESFEEAGVLGVLGPKLTEIQYETRKGKKRRLEHEETERKRKTFGQESDPVKEDKIENKPSLISTEEIKNDDDYAFTAPIALSDEAMMRIRGEAQAIAPKASDETASIASTLSTATYSQVRMTLFPLYVSKVLDSWPESGRFRKAVDIDEAIAMTDARPELKAVLMDVKERGLHLMSAPLEAPTSTPTV
jgi:diphosphoinositol-polyphosphate diphosphatase